MKRRILSIIIIGVFVASVILSGVRVSAAPSDQQLQQQRNEYEAKKAKVNEIDEKIQRFDDEISSLTIKVNDNDSKIKDINKEIENTDKEIEQTKTDITNKEELLGKRLRSIYKSGGEADYISLIFSSNSLGDLITKVNSAIKIVSTDKKVLKDLSSSKSKLDDKVNSLETKSNEIQGLNNDIQQQKAEINKKLEEEKQVREQSKAEVEQFAKQYLIPIERESVQGFIDIANNPNSSESQLNDAITALSAIKNQLKSSEVQNEVNNAIENAKNALKKISDNKITPAAVNPHVPTPSPTSTSVVSYAYKFLGVAYVYGATGPENFDCSGLTSYVYRNVTGIDIGRTTYEQVNAGVDVTGQQLQPGDLIFPSDEHVQMYIGNGQVIHAPHTGDVVRIAPIGTVWKARRIL
ncbi:C40 family peptidase [Clostridium sp. HBUAS56017]|uniref:C40 family peptidase n=1 Tax=Clostridium sp. HBUAS56017 TaxID=2571128 RepID=UPI001177E43C|nr:C40 family peptidase [Clostridium sp. HBUAS56017]